MSENINEFNMIITQLWGLEVKIQEEDKALMFLSSFPPLYEHLVTPLIYWKDTLEIKEVTATLLSSKIRKTGNEKSQDKVLMLQQVETGEGGDPWIEAQRIEITPNLKGKARL